MLVDHYAGGVYVGVHPVAALHDGYAVPEIARIGISLPVQRRAVRVDVEIQRVILSHRAAALLEVAAPREPTFVQRTSVRQDVEPPPVRLHRGASVVEPEGSHIA